MMMGLLWEGSGERFGLLVKRRAVRGAKGSKKGEA